MSQSRIHFMDPMRGVLMLLGIVLHTAQIYNPNTEWLVKSPIRLQGSEHIVDLIHHFRMPAFFVISGFFCLLTLEKYGANKFIRHRALRIGVPIVFVSLTLNSIQSILITYYGFGDYALPDYFLEGDYVTHLWFLNNLLIYFTIVFVIARWVWTPAMYRLTERGISQIFRNKLSFCVFVPLASLAIYAVRSAIYQSVPSDYTSLFGFVDLWTLLEYAPYFLVGMGLYASRNAVNHMIDIGWITLVAVLLLCQLIYLSLDLGVTWQRSLNVYVGLVSTWASVVACFKLFAVYFSKATALGRWLSDASYSIYLVHHLLVIGFGIIFINLEMYGWHTFFFIMIVVTIVSASFHSHIVQKYRWARFAFNGR